MVEQTFAAAQGIWLKGNLHCHTTVSEGHTTPEQVIRMYEEAGYDFLSLTEHNIYTEYEDHGNLVVIPGFELSGILNDKEVHINFIQRIHTDRFRHGQEIRVGDERETLSLIEELKDEYWILLNHPDWSLLEFRDVEQYNLFDAMEVFNYGSEWHERVGESSHFWDTALMHGKRWPAVATDDNHNRFDDSPGWPNSNFENDSFGGWTMAKCADKSREAILQALDTGSFYATSGPKIYDFRVIGEYASVSCSPVCRIIFKGEQRNYVQKLGRQLTGCTTKLAGNKRYVRVECIDEKGNVAYSNPIFLS